MVFFKLSGVRLSVRLVIIYIAVVFPFIMIVIDQVRFLIIGDDICYFREHPEKFVEKSVAAELYHKFGNVARRGTRYHLRALFHSVHEIGDGGAEARYKLRVCFGNVDRRKARSR